MPFLAVPQHGHVQLLLRVIKVKVRVGQEVSRLFVDAGEAFVGRALSWLWCASVVAEEQDRFSLLLGQRVHLVVVVGQEFTNQGDLTLLLVKCTSRKLCTCVFAFEYILF